MTTAQLQARIAEILALIAQLQAQLAQMQGGTTITAIPSTYRFEKPLYFGLTSQDVKYLQVFLKSQGVTISSTGYFGPVTRQAVINFQVKNGIIISSASPGAGLVGVKTRAKINEVIKK